MGKINKTKTKGDGETDSEIVEQTIRSRNYGREGDLSGQIKSQDVELGKGSSVA